MKEFDILRDVLSFKIESQKMYNDNVVNLRNPEVRHLFTVLRDDEMRDIANLQQELEKMNTSDNILSKLFPNKP